MSNLALVKDAEKSLDFDFLSSWPVSRRPLLRGEVQTNEGGRRRLLSRPPGDLKDPRYAGRFGRDLAHRNMSFLTGTSAEVLYSSIATGTQLNTFTTEDNLMKTLPYCIIPAGFFYNAQGATGKCLRVKAMGRLGTTGTPTFTWSIRLLTSSTWSAAGLVMSTAAITAGSGVTLAPWYLDIEIIMRTLGAGATSTLAIMGELRGGTSLAAGGGVYSMPAANTAFTVTTYDASVTNYLFLSAACGTSNASNLIQLEGMKVYGEN